MRYASGEPSKSILPFESEITRVAYFRCQGVVVVIKNEQSEDFESDAMLLRIERLVLLSRAPNGSSKRYNSGL